MIKIAPDKWKHFIVGIPLGAMFQSLSLYFMRTHVIMAIITTFILVTAVSYGFELYSLISKRGHYEVLDAIAAIIGGVIGMALVLLLVSVF